MAGPEILIFDDDATFGDMTLDAVESAGYRAQLYRDGTRVLPLVQELRPRLIILDIMMPGLDGLSACKSLRADPLLKDLRIIVSSGKTVGQVGDQAMRMGADLYIPKPYVIDEFIGKVRGLIGEPAGAEPESAGDPIFVTVLGCGSAASSSAVAVEVGELLILLDAGSGLKNAGPLLADRKELRLMLTHYHPDHVEGLPYLRETGLPMTVCGPNDVDVSLSELVRRDLLAAGAPTDRVNVFTIVEGSFNLASGVRCSALYVNHPGTTLALSIEAFGKKIVYCPDNEIRPFVAGQMRDIESKLKAFARDADLLIHDARFTPADHELHRDEGHSSYPLVVDLAIDAAVQRLMLFHFDASYPEESVAGLCRDARAQAEGQLTSLDILAAKEGLRIQV